MIDRAIPDMLCWFVPAVFSHPRALNLSFFGGGLFLLFDVQVVDIRPPLSHTILRVPCVCVLVLALKSAFFGDPKDAKLKTTKGSTAADRLP